MQKLDVHVIQSLPFRKCRKVIALERVFFFLTVLLSLWDLSSPTRDRSYSPCTGSVQSYLVDNQ